MQIRWQHWLAALSAAILVHAGLAGLFYAPYQPPAGVRGVGISGIEIALGSASNASDAASTVMEAEKTVDHIQSLAAPEHEVKPETVVESKPEPKPEPRAESKSMLQPILQAEQKRVLQPESVTTVPMSQPVLKAEMVAEAESEPVTKVRANSSVSQKQTAVQDINGRTGMKHRSESGNGDIDTGGGISGAEMDYLSMLRTWLEQYKQYPSRAQRRQQEGTVYLHFVVDREGKVLSFRVKRSSGYTLLDREVERMISRAAPFPAMPDELMQSRLELVVPISFYMR